MVPPRWRWRRQRGRRAEVEQSVRCRPPAQSAGALCATRTGRKSQGRSQDGVWIHGGYYMCHITLSTHGSTPHLQAALTWALLVFHRASMLAEKRARSLAETGALTAVQERPKTAARPLRGHNAGRWTPLRQS
eukprot:364853-Chlamydomonas_euryale.AAC.5